MPLYDLLWSLHLAGSTLGIVIVVIDCLRRRSSAAASVTSALRIWEGNRMFDEWYCLGFFLLLARRLKELWIKNELSSFLRGEVRHGHIQDYMSLVARHRAYKQSTTTLKTWKSLIR